ncbi:MAG: pyridoxal phosphate-dependent aminotransferase [Actinobacteria bacterium]|nr:MAG: pyridoxal phosphate-dependent aminotransferase [Actinomycetota bacterium]
MTNRVSQRLQALPGSATMAISARARELAAEGQDVIAFAAGEPDFATPEHITAAAARAAHDPANHHYTANAGLPPLREAVARYTLEYSGVQVDASEVMITNGAKQAVYETFAALVDPGDEVLLPSPHWVTYPAGVRLYDGVPVPVETGIESGFKVTVEDLEKKRTPKTKILVFVSPSNPTGAVYTKDEALEIGEWAREHDIWVMADEIYQRLVYTGGDAPSIAAVTPRFENWILINGVAKAYAMTGWRVGWMIGPKDVVDAAARLQSHATSNVSNVSQHAALAALTGPQDTVEEMRLAFDRRRKLMYSMLAAIDGIACIEPEGAFYVFPDVSRLLGERWATSSALATSIIEDAAVALVPGESFGAPGFLRLSYATSDSDIEKGVERIARLISR